MPQPLRTRADQASPPLPFQQLPSYPACCRSAQAPGWRPGGTSADIPLSHIAPEILVCEKLNQSPCCTLWPELPRDWICQGKPRIPFALAWTWHVDGHGGSSAREQGEYCLPLCCWTLGTRAALGSKKANWGKVTLGVPQMVRNPLQLWRSPPQGPWFSRWTSTPSTRPRWGRRWSVRSCSPTGQSSTHGAHASEMYAI